MDNTCVIMFVRSPERGRVKSRLAASIGENAALELYKCFVYDLIEMLRKGRYNYFISFSPPDSQEEIGTWLGREHVLMPQIGDDLGQRMKDAFAKAFSAGFDGVVLIGSDCPDLSSLAVNDALSALETHNAVIGPSLDGGYYLIGFNRQTFIPSVFDKIEWSTERVFLQTTDVFRRAGCRPHILPQWRDVDALDDLRSLYYENKDRRFAGSATMVYLKNARLLPDVLT